MISFPLRSAKLRLRGGYVFSFSSYLVYLLSGFFFKMSVLKISTEIQTT